MTDIIHIIPILVFFSIILLGIGIFSYIGYRNKKRKLFNRLEHVVEFRGSWAGGSSSSSLPDSLKKRLLKMFHSLGERVKPKSKEELSHMRITLLKAGYHRQNAPVIFFGIKTFSTLILASIFIALKFFILKAIPSMHFIFFTTLLALIGFYIPNLWLHIKTDRRKDSILKGLPDALDLLVVCVEAGMGLDAAINRVSEEMRLSNKTIAEELQIVNLEMRAGKLRRDALRNLAVRTDLEEVKSLVTLLIQTEKFGTGIARALEVHSDFVRTMRYQKAEELAAKVPVKLLFPLILFIFPSLFVAILGPAAIRIYRTFLIPK